MVYRQIWLNFLVDDYQFGYITKLKKKKKSPKKKNRFGKKQFTKQ